MNLSIWQLATIKLKKHTYNRFLFVLLFFTILLFIQCNNKPKVESILFLNEKSIKKLVPKDYIVKHNNTKQKGVVYINDSLKLKYICNVFHHKDNSFINANSIVDTINNRICRILNFQEKTNKGYTIDFKIIDIKANEIPGIFGNPNKKNMYYEIFSLHTVKNKLISPEDKNELTKSLFSKDFINF